MLDRSFIRQSAAAAGFDLCGVAPCRHLVRNEQFFRRWLGDGRHASLGYLERNLDKRFDVRRLVEGGADGSRLRRRLQERPERRLSRRLPREDRLVCPDRRLPCHDQGDAGRPLRASSCRGACPRRPGVRRFGSARGKAAGRRSGAGWIGRQSLLVTPRFGSFVLLGELVLDAACDRYDEPLAGAGCGSCRRCVEACPTGAVCNDARSMRAAASPVIRSNGRRPRKLPSTGGFSAATPARAAAPTTSVRRCIFIRRSIRCSIPCRSRPNGGSRWRRRNFRTSFGRTPLMRSGLRRLQANAAQNLRRKG